MVWSGRTGTTTSCSPHEPREASPRAIVLVAFWMTASLRRSLWAGVGSAMSARGAGRVDVDAGGDPVHDQGAAEDADVSAHQLDVGGFDPGETVIVRLEGRLVPHDGPVQALHRENAEAVEVDALGEDAGGAVGVLSADRGEQPAAGSVDHGHDDPPLGPGDGELRGQGSRLVLHDLGTDEDVVDEVGVGGR